MAGSARLSIDNDDLKSMITFSTAYSEYEEEMLGLFDAVISTIRWEVAPSETLAEA